MRRTLTTLAVGLAVLAALPAVASAQDNLGDVLGTIGLQNTLTQIGLPQISTPDVTDGNGTQQPATSEQPTTTPAKPAHSNGYYCRGQSKKHVRGQKGTPFSQCVTAMAKLQNGETASPNAACKPLSHKRVKGTKRTPFAACVAGGKRLILDLPA